MCTMSEDLTLHGLQVIRCSSSCSCYVLRKSRYERFSHLWRTLMNTPKAIIFDLDGVLTDTSEYHYQAWKHLADDEGIAFTHEENDAHLRGVWTTQLASVPAQGPHGV